MKTSCAPCWPTRRRAGSRPYPQPPRRAATTTAPLVKRRRNPGPKYHRQLRVRFLIKREKIFYFLIRTYQEKSACDTIYPILSHVQFGQKTCTKREYFCVGDFCMIFLSLRAFEKMFGRVRQHSLTVLNRIYFRLINLNFRLNISYKGLMLLFNFHVKTTSMFSIIKR